MTRKKPDPEPGGFPDLTRLAASSKAATPGNIRPNPCYGFVGLDALDPEGREVAVDGCAVTPVLHDHPGSRGLSVPNAEFLAAAWNLARTALAIFGAAPVWRPISTVPAGRKVDVWAWNAHRASRRFLDCRVVAGALVDKVGRRFDSPELHWKPTHWMPAPGRPPRRKRGD